MKRWDRNKGQEVEDAKVDAFLAELVEVCRKHGMSLGHEDHQGAFLVYRQTYSDTLAWLNEASIADETTIFEQRGAS